MTVRCWGWGCDCEMLGVGVYYVDVRWCACDCEIMGVGYMIFEVVGVAVRWWGCGSEMVGMRL